MFLNKITIMVILKAFVLTKFFTISCKLMESHQSGCHSEDWIESTYFTCPDLNVLRAKGKIIIFILKYLWTCFKYLVFDKNVISTKSNRSLHYLLKLHFCINPSISENIVMIFNKHIKILFSFTLAR